MFHGLSLVLLSLALAYYTHFHSSFLRARIILVTFILMVCLLLGRKCGYIDTTRDQTALESKRCFEDFAVFV